MGVGRAVGRQRKKTSSFVQWRDATTFAADESVSREALCQHSIETYQGMVHIVASKCVQGITGTIERIDAEIGIPIAYQWPAGANHAHDQAAVLLLVVRNPILLNAAGGKDAAGNRVTDNNVPVAADAHIGNRVMWAFVRVKCNRHERRVDIALRA